MVIRPICHPVMGSLLMAHALFVWANAEIQVKAQAAPVEAYVGQQIILTVSAIRPPNTEQGQLSEPQLRDATASLLGAIEVDTELRDGIAYSVLRKRYAIVPSKSGTLTISGLRYQRTAVDAQQFTGGRGAIQRQGKVLASSAPDIELRILAPLQSAASWLPATELRLTDIWSKPPHAVRIGEAITRTVVVSASGIPADRLPRIRMRDHVAYVLHTDQPTLHTDYRSDGIHARRVQRFVLLLTEQVELPSMAVRWYDVASSAQREARIERISLATDGPIEAPAAAYPGPEPQSLRLPLALASGVLLVILIGVWLVRRWRERHIRHAISAIRRACRRDDAQAVKTALIRYGQLRWPGAVHLNLIVIGQRLHGDARQALGELDRHLYGRAENWQGTACWQQLATALKQPRPRPTRRESPGALTRLQAPPVASESA